MYYYAEILSQIDDIW